MSLSLGIVWAILNSEAEIFPSANASVQEMEFRFKVPSLVLLQTQNYAQIHMVGFMLKLCKISFEWQLSGTGQQ